MPLHAQRTYSTTAINYDFALITLASPVSPGLGYFGIQRGSGTQTLNIMSAGYPADKPTGTMWGTSCQGVEYAYGQNQGVFKDVSQCQNQVSILWLLGIPASPRCMHGASCGQSYVHCRPAPTFCSTAAWPARGNLGPPCGTPAAARSTPSSPAR